MKKSSVIVLFHDETFIIVFGTKKKSKYQDRFCKEPNPETSPAPFAIKNYSSTIRPKTGCFTIATFMVTPTEKDVSSLLERMDAVSRDMQTVVFHIERIFQKLFIWTPTAT